MQCIRPTDSAWEILCAWEIVKLILFFNIFFFSSIIRSITSPRHRRWHVVTWRPLSQYNRIREKQKAKCHCNAIICSIVRHDRCSSHALPIKRFKWKRNRRPITNCTVSTTSISWRINTRIWVTRTPAIRTAVHRRRQHYNTSNNSIVAHAVIIPTVWKMIPTISCSPMTRAFIPATTANLAINRRCRYWRPAITTMSSIIRATIAIMIITIITRQLRTVKIIKKDSSKAGQNIPAAIAVARKKSQPSHRRPSINWAAMDRSYSACIRAATIHYPKWIMNLWYIHRWRRRRPAQRPRQNTHRSMPIICEMTM